jgi:hypothetical protein
MPTRQFKRFFSAGLFVAFAALIFEPTAQGQTAYNGYLDYAGCGSISGWALDWNRLTTSITVSIYDGNNPSPIIPPFLASNYRPDLATGGDASTQYHGFVVGTPTSLLDGQTHSIWARFESSSSTLFNTPIALTCHSYNGYADSATTNAIAGWALDWNQIENPITVDIYDGSNLLAAGVSANIYRGDLATGGDYQSKVHGFSYPTPLSLLDGNYHEINIAYGGTGIYLQNSGDIYFGKIGDGTFSGCPPVINPSVWRYKPIYYQTTTSLSPSSIAAAVNAWNIVQNKLNVLYYIQNGNPVNPNNQFTYLSDSNLGDTVAGLTTAYYGTPSTTGCFDKIDSCGVCENGNSRIYATMELNASGLANIATGPQTKTSLENLSTTLLSHEFGHVLNLNENQVFVSNVNNIQTVMYQGAQQRALGGILLPQTACDGGSVTGYYNLYPPINICSGGPVCTSASATCQ